MQSEEQRLIDGLFSRLKEAEAHSASRDASAEERIAQHVSAQPAAPYYMAQTILIQEAAIKQLNDRIQALESQVSQLQAAKPSSGGFLSGLFGGGGSSRGSDPIPGAEQYGRPQASAQPQYTPPPQVTIRSARETISSLPTIPGTTISTPALATMILAAMTIAGFNPGDA